MWRVIKIINTIDPLHWMALVLDPPFTPVLLLWLGVPPQKAECKVLRESPPGTFLATRKKREQWFSTNSCVWPPGFPTYSLVFLLWPPEVCAWPRRMRDTWSRSAQLRCTSRAQLELGASWSADIGVRQPRSANSSWSPWLMRKKLTMSH